MAEEAPAFHVEGLLADDEVLPDPSNLDKIIADDSSREAAAILVPIES